MRHSGLTRHVITSGIKTVARCLMGESISLEKHEEMHAGIVPKYLMSQRQPLVQIGYFKIGIKILFYYRRRVTRKECIVSNF